MRQNLTVFWLCVNRFGMYPSLVYFYEIPGVVRALRRLSASGLASLLTMGARS